MKHQYTSWHESPEAIVSAAWLYHFRGADIREASVLEIGCGKGEVLLRQAACWSACQFTGVDIDAERICHAQRSAQEQQLDNLQFCCLSLADLLAADVEKYDYIIIPSLYAMLDPGSRAELLAWCQRHLSEKGILAVKWNTLPGATENRTLQQAIVLHCRDARTENEWVTLAREMLYLTDMSAQDARMKACAQLAQRLNDDELVAQYMDDRDDAGFFVEFAAQANANQLRVLGDVNPVYEIPAHYDAQVANMARLTAAQGNSPLMAQQYLDFAVNRRERFTLLVSLDTQQDVRSEPDLSRLADMHWAANYQRESGKSVYRDAAGHFINTSDRCTRNILNWLESAWPRSLHTGQIIHHAAEPEATDDTPDSMMVSLRALYLSGPSAFYVTLGPSAYNETREEGIRLAGVMGAVPQVDESLPCTNWRGEQVTVTAAEWQWYTQGTPLSTAEEGRIALGLAGKGVLSMSPAGWLHFYRQILAMGDHRLLKENLRPFLLSTFTKRHHCLLPGGASAIWIKNKPSPALNAQLRKAETLMNQEELAQARELTSSLLASHPDNIHVQKMYEQLCLKTKNYDEALLMAGRRLGCDSDTIRVLYCYAAIQRAWTPDCLSLKQIAQWLIKYPDCSQYARGQSWRDLSVWYKNNKRVKAEVYCLRKSIAVDPGQDVTWMALGAVYNSLGRQEEAERLIRQGLELDTSITSQIKSRGMFNFVLSTNPRISAVDKFREAQAYGALLNTWRRSVAFPPLPARRHSEGKKIRLGFVSGDLRQHPVHFFLWPIWDSVDRNKYELFAYHTETADNITRQYSASAKQFRQVEGLSLTELARTIREDEIDVLIDLSGFTAAHRLPVFSLRLAPVQMSWIGFVGSTGVPQMDYYLTYTGLAEPGELDPLFSEKLIFMPVTRAFDYPVFAPTVNRLPALTNGYLTLGSFNRPEKLTAEILDCWTEILEALPDARLLVGAFPDETVMEHYLSEMVRRGVSADRLELHKKCGLTEYFELHHRVDVLLDTHPYSAGTTAQYGLWMGLPHVTQTGETAVSRTAAYAMRSLGLDTFVVRTREEYVQKVIALNTRYDWLDSVRQSMRERVTRRADCHSHNACYFETVIDTVWQRYVAGEKPEPLVIKDLHPVDKTAFATGHAMSPENEPC